MKMVKMSQKGFSLIELMIVVGIIGILATLAAPKLKTFQAKAKQSEGKMVLNQIYTLNEAYSIENDKYAGAADETSYYGYNPSNGTAICTPFNELAGIGFSVTPCDARNPRYAYNLETGTSTFVARAITGSNGNNRVNLGCLSRDYMNLDNTKAFNHVADTTKVDCAAADSTTYP